jgi:hypothetical protein
VKKRPEILEQAARLGRSLVEALTDAP